MEETAVPITSASVAGRVQPLRRNPGGVDDAATSRQSTLPSAPPKVERRASDSISFSSGAAVLNFVSSILGVSVLGMPFCFLNCGIALGALLLSLSCLTAHSSGRMLLACSQIAGSRSFEELSQKAMGEPGRKMVEIAQILLQFGSLVAYTNILADILSSVAGTIIPPGAEPSRPFLVFFVISCVFMPLALKLSTPESSSFASLLSVVCIFLFTVVITGVGIDGSSAKGSVTWVKTNGIFVSFPVAAFAFTANPTLFVIFRRSLYIILTTHLTVGFMGYMAFGDVVAGDVLRNFSMSNIGSYARLVKSGFGIAIICSSPLCMMPLRQSLASLLRVAITKDTQAVLTIMVYSSVLMAALTVPNLELILGLTGATSSVLLSYIMPSLIFLRIYCRHRLKGKDREGTEYQPTLFDRRKAEAMLVFGVIMAFVCTRAIVTAVHDEHEVVSLAKEIIATKSSTSSSLLQSSASTPFTQTSSGSNSMENPFDDRSTGSNDGRSSSNADGVAKSDGESRLYLRDRAQNVTNAEKLTISNENKRIITLHANKSDGQDDQGKQLNEGLKLTLEKGQVSDPVELSAEDDGDVTSDDLKKTTKTNTEKGSTTVYSQDESMDAEHIQDNSDNSDNSISSGGAAGAILNTASIEESKQENLVDSKAVSDPVREDLTSADSSDKNIQATRDSSETKDSALAGNEMYSTNQVMITQLTELLEKVKAVKLAAEKAEADADMAQVLAKEANSNIMHQYILQNITSSSESRLSAGEDLNSEPKQVDNLADVRQKNETESQSGSAANMSSSGELMQYNESSTTVAQSVSNGLTSVRSDDRLINTTITLPSGFSNLSTLEKKGSIGTPPSKSIARKLGPLEKNRDRGRPSTTENTEEIQALEDRVKSTAEAATKALEAAQATRKAADEILQTADALLQNAQIVYKTTDSLQKKNDAEKLRRAEEIAQAFDSQFETPKTNSSATFFGRLVGLNKDKDTESESSPVMESSTNNEQGIVLDSTNEDNSSTVGSNSRSTPWITNRTATENTIAPRSRAVPLNGSSVFNSTKRFSDTLDLNTTVGQGIKNHVRKHNSSSLPLVLKKEAQRARSGRENTSNTLLSAISHRDNREGEQNTTTTEPAVSVGISMNSTANDDVLEHF